MHYWQNRGKNLYCISCSGLVEIATHAVFDHEIKTSVRLTQVKLKADSVWKSSYSIQKKHGGRRSTDNVQCAVQVAAYHDRLTRRRIVQPANQPTNCPTNCPMFTEQHTEDQLKPNNGNGETCKHWHWHCSALWQCWYWHGTHCIALDWGKSSTSF